MTLLSDDAHEMFILEHQQNVNVTLSRVSILKIQSFAQHFYFVYYTTINLESRDIHKI